MNITSRLPDIGTSIFSIMSKMAVEHGAINLSQGFPDFPIDEKLINLVHHYMLEGNNQYAPMPGLPALRQSIAEVILSTYHRQVDPETDITITAGGTQAIFSIISAFVSQGDEVILFDPAYDSYDPAIRLNGGIPIKINLRYPDFSIDWERVISSISAKTKMIMINTPQNPSGAVLSENDLRTLEDIAVKHNLIVLSDEVYERLIFDGIKHQSVLSRPALASQSLAVFSFGKTFHATGWKSGYIVGPENLMREVRKTHQFIVFSVNTPLQWALSEYLREPEHYLTLGSFYQQKRDFFLKQIEGSSWQPLPCHGSYFQLLSYKNFSNKSDIMMAETLTQRDKVASIPISAFYKDKSDNKLLRFCFAKKEETLEKACAILRKF
jgi:methionine aminotransferase